MKYTVTDPTTHDIVAVYELNEKGEVISVNEPGPHYLYHDSQSKESTLIQAVLETHRRQGRIVTEEP